MDSAVSARLREEINLLTRLRLEVEELSIRVATIEGRYCNGGVGFDYRSHVAQRRRAVTELRRSGMSIALIAKRLGIAASTAQRDLERTPHITPDYVTGLDSKVQPVRKGGRAGA